MYLKRSSVVKNIHKVFSHGDSFAALRFGGKLPLSGDMVCLHLACVEVGRAYGVYSLSFIAALQCAKDYEHKIGFITYKALIGMFERGESSRIIMKLVRAGLLEVTHTPDTYSHILRRVRCYKLTDKGRKCLRLFSDVFNLYQREVKRAKIKGV